ncbi:uncharacterized protein LOC134872044 isoform X3 [Eleginops maclovinus]|uniref:uncharacterized protein LOC134872044 isoform X3 n=1 Tax=Eleginops maclovinus TaxID=56733 RepID=UPI00307FE8E7
MKKHSADYQCSGRVKYQKSEIVRLTVLGIPKPVLNVSRSWLSPGAAVTLNCSVNDSAPGWRFYWYKAVANLSINSNYSYELLPGNSNGTEHNTYVVTGQTDTAGYACRAGRGNPVFYSWYSRPRFVWSGDSLALSVKVSPDRVQHFPSEPVSLSCEWGPDKWRVMRFTERLYLSNCADWGTKNGTTWTITNLQIPTAVYWYDIRLVSPVHPVTVGDSVCLSCKLQKIAKSGSPPSKVSFYLNDHLIQKDTSAELKIAAVSKSHEGFYKCQYADKKSARSWLSVKSASSPGKRKSPILLLAVIGSVCGIPVLILLLLSCFCMKSKDSSSRTTLFQRTNQSSAPDQAVHLNETQPHQPPSHLQDKVDNVTYSLILHKNIRGTDYPSAAVTEETIYSEVKLDTALGNNAAMSSSFKLKNSQNVSNLWSLLPLLFPPRSIKGFLLLILYIMNVCLYF